MTVTLGRAACQRLADAAMDAAGASDTQVEVVVTRDAEALTRFANSQIHQNVWRDDVAVSVRVVLTGGRIGVASIHTDDAGEVALAAKQAAALAAVSQPDDDFPGLAPAAATEEVHADEATMAATPGDRATTVRALLGEVPRDYEAAGAFRTGSSELAVFTSTGQSAYAPTSMAGLTVVVAGGSSSGYAEAGGRSIADVDALAAGKAATDKAAAGCDPVAVPAGAWPVILEPPAVASLIQFLVYLGFGGRDWLEGRTFTAGGLGRRVVDHRITVVEDALSAMTVGAPFDPEGSPKQRIVLVDAGVAAGVVHDRYTAAQAGTMSTGHALPAPNAWGPMALNARLLPGADGSTQELIGRCERGLLVTRFHYTNVVNPKETSITGMTRDGTFLVVDGRISSPVRNLRFTQSILAALASVDGISTQTQYATELFEHGSQFPALALPAFNFSGTTSFG